MRCPLLLAAVFLCTSFSVTTGYDLTHLIVAYDKKHVGFNCFQAMFGPRVYAHHPLPFVLGRANPFEACDNEITVSDQWVSHQETDGAGALVGRGTCWFVDKARSVENSGGSGMVVINNQPDGHAWMDSPECGDPALPEDACNNGRGWWEDLGVASCMVSKDDGATLSTMLRQSNSGLLHAIIVSHEGNVLVTEPSFSTDLTVGESVRIAWEIASGWTRIVKSFRVELVQGHHSENTEDIVFITEMPADRPTPEVGNENEEGDEHDRMVEYEYEYEWFGWGDYYEYRGEYYGWSHYYNWYGNDSNEDHMPTEQYTPPTQYEYEWTIPETIPTDLHYVIRVTSFDVEGNAVGHYAAESEYYMSITNPDTHAMVTITYPDSPEDVWYLGNEYTITWETTPSTEAVPNVDIVLRNHLTSQEVLIAGGIPNTGAFDYRLPTPGTASAESGTVFGDDGEYFVWVGSSDTNKKYLHDWSNYKLSIQMCKIHPLHRPKPLFHTNSMQLGSHVEVKWTWEGDLIKGAIISLWAEFHSKDERNVTKTEEVIPKLAKWTQPDDEEDSADCYNYPDGWMNYYGYSCEWFETQSKERCKTYGDDLGFFGYTANTACCACGKRGGLRFIERKAKASVLLSANKKHGGADSSLLSEEDMALLEMFNSSQEGGFFFKVTSADSKTRGSCEARSHGIFSLTANDGKRPICPDIMCTLFCEGGYVKGDDGCKQCRCKETSTRSPIASPPSRSPVSSTPSPSLDNKPIPAPSHSPVSSTPSPSLDNKPIPAPSHSPVSSTPSSSLDNKPIPAPSPSPGATTALKLFEIRIEADFDEETHQSEEFKSEMENVIAAVLGVNAAAVDIIEVSAGSIVVSGTINPILCPNGKVPPLAKLNDLDAIRSVMSRSPVQSVFSLKDATSTVLQSMGGVDVGAGVRGVSGNNLEEEADAKDITAVAVAVVCSIVAVALVGVGAWYWTYRRATNEVGLGISRVLFYSLTNKPIQLSHSLRDRSNMDAIFKNTLCFNSIRCETQAAEEGSAESTLMQRDTPRSDICMDINGGSGSTDIPLDSETSVNTPNPAANADGSPSNLDLEMVKMTVI